MKKKEDMSIKKKEETSLTNADYQRNRLYKKGINFMADEKLEEASRSFEMILRTDPNDVEAMLKLGYSRFHLDDYSAAMRVYDKILDIDITNSEAWNLKSLVYYEKKNFTKALDNAEKRLKKIKEIFAIVAVSPRAAGLEMKKPYIFEAMVSGGDIQKQFTHVKELLGKEIKIDQIFETGATVDVAAITKGHGWQGTMRRWGVKKKQHKSRKTVREVGSLGPISPQSVMYTVPRSGQTGFHQRVEYDKRIMVMGNTDNDKLKINPDGGYKHFGLVNGDFIILKGSVPGTYRRLIKLRSQIRNAPAKVNKPNILEVVI